MLRGAELQAAAANSAIVQRFAVALLQPEAVLATGPDDAENSEVVLDGAHLHLTAVLLHQLLTKPESFLATAGSGAPLSTLLLTLIAADYMLVRTEFTEQLAARIAVLIRTTVLEDATHAKSIVQALDAVQRVYAVSGQTDTELPLAMLQFARPLVDALLFCRQPWAQKMAAHPVMRALAMCNTPDEAVTDVSTTWHYAMYGGYTPSARTDGKRLPPAAMTIELDYIVRADAVTALATLQLPRLTRLDLSYCKKTITDTHVCPLAQQCGHTLQYIGLRGLHDGVTAATLWAIAYWCPGLVALDARDCIGLWQTTHPWATQQDDAAAAVCAIVQQCYGLQTLLLNGSHCTTVDVLQALPQRAATLREIGIDLLVVRLPPMMASETAFAYAIRTEKLRSAERVRIAADRAVHKLRQRCTQVLHVTCSGNNHNKDYYAASGPLPLDMVGSRRVQKLLADLAMTYTPMQPSWHLRTIRYRNGLALTCKIVATPIAAGLLEFDAHGPGFNDKPNTNYLADSMQTMTQLRTLRVQPSPEIDTQPLLVKMAQTCGALTTLALRACYVADHYTPLLAQLPLTDLELSVSGLTGSGLRLLADNGLTTLRELRLYDCPGLKRQGSDGLPWLVRHNPQLEVLHVGGEKTYSTYGQAVELVASWHDDDEPVGPDGDGLVARAPALRELVLREPLLRTETYLADLYILYLAKYCPRLQRLMLVREDAHITAGQGGSSVTVGALQELEQGCTQLQCVTLSQAVFPDATRTAVATAKPWVLWKQQK